MREIGSIRFKRIHLMSPMAGDIAGHWWFEIGNPEKADSESYGWYPKEQIHYVDALIGVVGQLNDGLSGLVPPRDPHHGEAADEAFHPLAADDDQRTDEEIEDCLRLFANSYAGRWQWLLGWGQNCHTFQKAAMRHCGLFVPSHIRKTKL